MLLLPDLRCLPLGLVGLLLAMMMLEMLRMAVDIATWGMSRAAFLAYRVVVVAGLVAGGFAVGTVIVREERTRSDQRRRGAARSACWTSWSNSNASVFGYAARAISAVRRPDRGRQDYGSQSGAGHCGLAIVAGLAAASLACTRRLCDAWPGGKSETTVGAARREQLVKTRAGELDADTGVVGAPTCCDAYRVGAAPARSPGGNWSAPVVIGAAC